MKIRKKLINKLLLTISLLFVGTDIVYCAPVKETVECTDISEVIDLVALIYNYVKIGLTVALVILSMLDFGKAVMGEAEEQLKKAQKHLMTRIIILAIMFLLPLLISWIIDLVSVPGFSDSCISNL